MYHPHEAYVGNAIGLCNMVSFCKFRFTWVITLSTTFESVKGRCLNIQRVHSLQSTVVTHLELSKPTRLNLHACFHTHGVVSPSLGFGLPLIMRTQPMLSSTVIARIRAQQGPRLRGFLFYGVKG